MKTVARHTWIIAAALYAAVALVFLAPVLLNGDVVIYGLDTLTEEYPMYWWGWTQIKETGQVPWWCPHLFGGYPFVASFSFCPFYPPQWLSLLMDFPAAYNWQFFLVLWMAGCCGYAGLRLAGWPRGLALAGGLLWMTCGHVVTLIYPGHLKKMQALVWVPLAWGGVAGALRAMAIPDLIPPMKSSSFLSRVSYFFKNPIGLFVIAGVAMAMQLLAHHSQIFYFSVMMVGLYWVWIAAMGEGDEKIPKSKRRKIIFKGGLIGLIGAGLVAVGLSAVQMFPSMHMASMSNRAGGVSFEEATITSYPPEELLEFALPQLWGDSVRRRSIPQWKSKIYTGIVNKEYFNWLFPITKRVIPSDAIGVYVGRWNYQTRERLVSDYIGISVLILTGFGLVASRRRERWLWLVVIVLISFIAIGSYTPIFNILWHIIPLLDRFRSPGTAMFVISWGIMMLALLGMECLIYTLDLKKWLKYLTCVMIGLTFVLCLGFIINYYKNPQSVLKTISFGRSSIIMIMVCWVIGTTAFIVSRPKYMKWTSYIGPAIVCWLMLIQTIDMWDHTQAFVQPEPYTTGYARYLFYTPPDNFLAAQPQPFRMIQYNNELATRFLARGLNSTHGLHPITFQKYFDILDRAWFYDPLFIHLYNQQYVIVRGSEALPDGYDQVVKGGGYHVGRYDSELKHAWLTTDVKAIESMDNLFQQMKHDVENREFYQHAYISDYLLAEAAIVKYGMTFDQKATSPTLETAVTRYAAGEMEIHVKSSDDAFLIVSEHAAPGWRAQMDNGQTLRPISVNYLFQMYPAPKGEHTYTLTYRQPLARAGLVTTILTILAITGIIFSTAQNMKRHSLNQINHLQTIDN